MGSDEESFVRWASQHPLALLRNAVLLTGAHHRAEDLVQEALTKVALRFRRLQSSNPDAYARRVLVRTNISLWRKTRREVVTADPVAHAAPDDSSGVDRRLLLDGGLARLTPRQGAMVVLRFYDDLDVQEAADVLGVSAGTVKSQ